MTGREVLYLSKNANVRIGEMKSRSSRSKDEKVQVEWNLKMMVSAMMHRSGIPVNVKGYSYLREAVLLAAHDMDILNAVTKELYPEISGKFGVTSASVERAIRHAIELAWDHGNLSNLQNSFGAKTSWLKRKPTNKRFIAILADRINLDLKSAL
jgi:two-component system response regulator (stage 0 sporulation protein A)